MVGDYCYFFSGNTTNNFEGAYNSCRTALEAKPGAPVPDLVSVKNSVENDLLVTMLKNFGPAFWIGLRQNQSSGFLWADGRPYVFSHWGVQEDQATNLSTCAALMNEDAQTGFWRNRDCSESNGYICKAAKDSRLPSTVPDVDLRCPKGFRYKNDICFLVKKFREPVSWDEADTKCRLFGGVLATIRDIYENAQFRVALNYLDSSDTAKAWMSTGAENFRPANTSRQQSFPGLLESSKNVESFHDRTPCAYMHSGGKWFITSCSNSFLYALCEKRFDEEIIEDFNLTTITLYPATSDGFVNTDNFVSGPIIRTTEVAPIDDPYPGLTAATISWIVFGLLLSVGFVSFLIYVVYTGRSIFVTRYLNRVSGRIKRSFLNNMRRHRSTDRNELTLQDIVIV
ncbi:lymphocyte antigen 75-like isoform X2 [Paramacrobiotus metropolitanus]|uniref:lymphocyte antigen 75-like isoform X2 n=1 Tax=Paramacrobiotus metropolitanus TaxID=2943436 RepID=UPI0024463FCD|nr:lymphocyte antigen 75-like isoform X2 [Paramacrobiotus metropolitanus]